MKRCAPLHTQRGVALWMLLIAVVLAGGYAFYRSANTGQLQPQRDARLAATLARAKEALIARAVTDDNRPGSLPCPDLVTNSLGLNNVPGDGKADMFTLTQCPSYAGWLPWVTLDLPELADDSGTRLWYVLAPALRDDDSAQPINSDTATGLQVDGNADVAALIIAPGAPLPGQNRPSNIPADYLDGENGNGNDHKYVTGPRGLAFNDTVLIITRQELMAAVEKRVANEVRSCLEQHAAAAANADHRYPWPAPFSAASQQGKAGSYFGRVPASQPTSGPEAALRANRIRLSEAQTLVGTSTDASRQLAALNDLGSAIAQARNLFDAIFTATNKLKQSADAATGRLQPLEASLAAAIANDRISRAEGTAIRSLADGADTTLTPLPDLLVQQGIDVFPVELARRNATLGTSITAAALSSSSQAILQLLAATTTPRTDIGPSLLAAQNAAANAVVAADDAARHPGHQARLLAAQAAANTLLAADNALLASVEASRVSILASDASSFIAPLDNLKTTLAGTPTPANAAALLVALVATQAAVDRITTGVASVQSAIAAATNALADARSAAQASPPDYALIGTRTAAASDRMKQLAAAIAGNEQVDNNLSHTSVSAALADYEAARSSFSAVDTASPRPVQRTITPFAQTLADAAVDLDSWAKIISANAAIIAPLAKANPVAAGSDPATAAVLGGSAYQVAGDALASITGKKESAELLQAYIASPSADNQAKAIAALAETSSLVSALLDLENTLDTQLSSTTASAQPMLWASSRCDFLLPNSASWWKGNQWAGSVFYQISAPLLAAPGTLKVNAAGSYRVVAQAAGRALPGQNRGVQAASSYLEGINADNSRNGDATAPSPNFTAGPPSANFNDRLAY